jgi:predicted nucleotidyltransferase
MFCGLLIMASKEDYDRAVDEFIGSIKSGLSEKVISVYATGSYARGDFVPGRSDIDIYVVTKVSDSDVEKELRSFADPIVEKYLRDVKLIQPDVLSLAVTNLEDIRAGKSWLGIGWEYYVFKRESKLLYGEDIRPLIPEPDPKAIHASARDVLNNMVFSRGKFIYYIFSAMFRMLAIFLSMRDVYIAAKLDAFREFDKLYPSEKESVNAVKRAYELWNVWSERDLDDQEVSELIHCMLKVHETINRLMSEIPNEIAR